MDLPIEQLMALAKGEPGSGLVQSILLGLIWLNIRSLKQAIIKLEEGHDKRIGVLESLQEKNEVRLTALEGKG